MNYSKIIKDGLWTNNPGLVQLLGLCPLLAVSNTFINGLGMGIATLIVLVGSNITVAAIRDVVPREIRIPIFVMVIAAYVTLVELAMNAWLHDLYKILGLFTALITTNCAIIGRAEAFAAKNSIRAATVDGLAHGIGFTLALVVLGAGREILAQGTLFDGADMLLGSGFADLKITLIADYGGFLLAALPPGAFLGLGLLIAAKNMIDKRLEQRAKQAAATTAADASA